MINTCRRIETVIVQLIERCYIQKVRAKDLWHLTHRITRNILSHIIVVNSNMRLGSQPYCWKFLLKLETSIKAIDKNT